MMRIYDDLGKEHSRLIYEIKWINKRINFYKEYKKELCEKLENEKKPLKIKSLIKKIRKCKLVINGFIQYIIDCKSEIKNLQRQNPKNMKKHIA